MGTLGGAVAIDSPNFVDDSEESLSVQPYVIIKGNQFVQCQSYISGNAIYFRATRQRLSLNETEEACGAGLNVVANTFTENSPITHTANGGAVSLECDFVSEGASKISGGASNTIYVEPFQTIWASEYTNDPWGYT